MSYQLTEFLVPGDGRERTATRRLVAVGARHLDQPVGLRLSLKASQPIEQCPAVR